MDPLAIISASGILLTIACIIYFILYKKNGKIHYEKKLLLADKYLKNEEPEKAKRLLELIIISVEESLKENIGGTGNKKAIETLSNTYFKLADIYERENKPELAFIIYKKAVEFDITLNSSAIISLGREYLKQNQAHAEAINAYIDFIRLKPTDTETGQIYLLLEKNLVIDESTTIYDRMFRMECIRKILICNPLLEWAEYYLAIGNFLDGNYSQGVAGLINALNLNSTRPLLFYYLGQGFLHEFYFDEEKVTNIFNRFLEFQSNDVQLLKKQGEAAFELGKLSIDKIGGLDINADLSEHNVVEHIITALYYFQISCSKDENNQEYLFYLGRTYSLNSNRNKAIDAFLKTIQIAPKIKEYYYYLALEYKNINDIPEAIENLNKTLIIDNNFNNAHNILAEIYLSLKEYQKAEEHCLSAIENGIKGFDCLFKLVHAQYHQEKYKEIVQQIDDASSIILNSDYSLEVGFFIARAYAKTSNFSNAINWYKKLAPNPRNSYYFSCTMANTGNYETAIELLNKVITSEGEFKSRSFVQLGKIYLKQGEVTKAEETFLKAMELNPEEYDSVLSLGILYYNSGKILEAETLFTKAVQMEPQSALARFGLGLIKELSGKYQDAVVEYESALSIASDTSFIKLRLGILFCLTGEYEKSLNYLQNIHDPALPTDSLLYYSGLSAFYCNDYNNSLKYWGKLLNRIPGDKVLQINMGIVHYLLGVQQLELKKFKETAVQWEMYYDLCSPQNGFNEDLSQVYFRIGLAEIKKETQNYEGAKSFFDKAVRLNPENIKYKYYHALCFYGMKKYSEFNSCLDELLEIDPKNEHYIYHKGLVLLNLGYKDEAMNYFDICNKTELKNSIEKYSTWIIANEKILNKQYHEAISLLEQV